MRILARHLEWSVSPRNVFCFVCSSHWERLTRHSDKLSTSRSPIRCENQQQKSARWRCEHRELYAALTCVYVRRYLCLCVCVRVRDQAASSTGQVLHMLRHATLADAWCIGIVGDHRIRDQPGVLGHPVASCKPNSWQDAPVSVHTVPGYSCPCFAALPRHSLKQGHTVMRRRCCSDLSQVP